MERRNSMDASYTSKATLFSAVQRNVYQVSAVSGLSKVISYGSQGAWHLEDLWWLIYYRRAVLHPSQRESGTLVQCDAFWALAKSVETNLDLPGISQWWSVYFQKGRYTGPACGFLKGLSSVAIFYMQPFQNKRHCRKAVEVKFLLWNLCKGLKVNFVHRIF